jgi:O-antigen/teichoic acid export membrane protein
MSLTRLVAWNTLVQIGGRLIGLLASIAFTALLTRHLGLATFGKMVAASTYVALFVILGDAGLYLVTVRRAAQDSERRATILGTSFVLRMLLPVLPLSIACLLVRWVPAARFSQWEDALFAAVVLLAVNAYFTLFGQFYIAIFRLHLRLDLAVAGEFASRIVMLLATLAVVAFDGGLLAAIGAMMLGTLTQFIYGWFVTRRFEPFRLQLDLSLAKSMLMESIPLAVVTLLGLVHFKIDTLLLSMLQPAHDVGVYGVAYKVHEVIIGFPGLFVGLLFPLFSRLAQQDPARLRLVFQRTFDVLALASVGVALMRYVAAPRLALILGAEMAARPMRILALALPPIFLSLGFTHLLLAEARQRWLVPLYIVLVVVNVVANLIFIRTYSYLGAAAVTVGTETLSLVILMAVRIGRQRWRVGFRSLWGVPMAIVIAWMLHGVTPAGTPGTRFGIHVIALAGIALAALALYVGGVLGFRILPLAVLRALLPQRTTHS